MKDGLWTLLAVAAGFVVLFLINQWAECGMVLCSGVAR